MTLICVPFAYEENMNSGVNISTGGGEKRGISEKSEGGFNFFKTVQS